MLRDKYNFMEILLYFHVHAWLDACFYLKHWSGVFRRTNRLRKKLNTTQIITWQFIDDNYSNESISIQCFVRLLLEWLAVTSFSFSHGICKSKIVRVIYRNTSIKLFIHLFQTTNYYNLYNLIRATYKSM